MDVLGADVVFVHVAHHLFPLRLSQTDAQRAECVKDDLNWESVNFILLAWQSFDDNLTLKPCRVIVRFIGLKVQFFT